MSNYYNDQWRLPNNENKDKQSNYSMDFDGVANEYIVSSLDGTGGSSSSFGSGSDLNLTISFWFKLSQLTTSFGMLSWATSPAAGGGLLLLVQQTSNGTVQVYIVANGAGYRYVSSTLTVDTWYNLTFTRTAADNTWRFYLNSVLDSTTYVDNGSVSGQSSATNFYIGSGYGGSGNFNGQIDAVSIYNYALSASQVTTLYGSSSTGIGNPMSLSPKPIAYYPLGDQDAFNGASYLTPNASLQDFVFSFSSSQEINCGNDSTVQLGTVFTMACWINTTSTSRGSIFGTYISNGYYIDLMASGTVQGGYHSTGSHFLRPSSSTVNDGKWHHVCYVISGTATDGSDLDVYVDGQLNNGSFTSSGTPSGAATTNPFKINLSGYAGRYTGKISNVQIFNTALPATGSNSIETLYNNGSPLTSMSGFTSLQGWWKLDASATYDSSTTTWTIEDSSSNSNDGTSSGMTQANLVQSDLSFTSGYSPYALDFDGANDNIIVNSNTGLNFGTGDFTYSLWGKINTTTSNPAFYGGGSGSNNPAANSGYLSIGVHTSQPTGYVGATRCWISGEVFNGTTIITDDNWHNIVLTRTSGVVQIYVDGNIEVMRDSSGNVVSNPTSSNSITNTNGISIGSFRTNANYINGSMSNASIWNAALTLAQVTEIYNEGVPSNLNNHSAYSNLISWWQLGSNSSFNTNWTVLDEKGSNNGTSVNMDEVDIVDGVGSYANGLSSGMGGDEVIGDAPYSTANSLSVNMDVLDRVTDTPS